MDYSYMSSTKVVFAVCIVYQTIYRINHLFQNGRALLKCQIFLPPTTGNPDIENSRSHAPRYDTYVPIVNRHFKTVLIFFVPVFLVVFWFRASCVVVEFHSSHSFANLTANYSSFSCVVRENSTGFDVFNITVRFVLCFLCCC
jgi:hypothetical protein